MARRRKNKAPALADLPPCTDPSAPIDAAAFLTHAQPVLSTLAADLAARAEASEAATEALRTRWKSDREAGLTADAFPVYLTSFVDQVAASWLLACVFVRTLEDRGLLEKHRIAGPGAADSLAAFRRLAPYLNERDYLLTVFAEVAEHPAVAGVFDREHALFWQLGPSGEAARELLALFSAGGHETPHYRFGQPDTRLLGDLYQDLNEAVRKRFALLQTPRFVESFILDRTLEPAIERFGLDEVTVFDPTCGSGHFLLGAFERLVRHRRIAEPAKSPREIAELALRAIHGCDLNPYAVAIARFRLILAYLDEAGFTHIADAPKLDLNLVVADSLLHNPKKSQLTLEAQPGIESGSILGARDLMRLDDPVVAKRVFNTRHAAVVGNPPFVAVADSALRETYRRMYTSASGKYTLSVPFTEAFFDYGRRGAYVGFLNANAFMRRSFGKTLVEKVLPRLDITSVINTAWVPIPGPSIQTLIILARSQPRESHDVTTVLAIRGEESPPPDPATSLAWKAIALHSETVGIENDYITVKQTPRGELDRHPWSLAGGGAAELKSLLESRAGSVLGDVASAIGVMALAGEDEIYIADDDGPFLRNRIPASLLRPLGAGEGIRDWDADWLTCLYPHDESGAFVLDAALDAYLWRFRAQLSKGIFFGRTKAERGLDWRAWAAVQKNKLEGGCTIAYAEVATHNHFVLDRGGKVFKQTAPIIKLPQDATEDDYLALLAYLNSSSMCFWIKQVAHQFGTSTGDVSTVKGKPENTRYSLAAGTIQKLPLPATLDSFESHARRMEQTMRERERVTPAAIVRAIGAGEYSRAEAEAAYDLVQRKAVARQEDLDWACYGAFGLADGLPVQPMSDDAVLAPEERPFLSDRCPIALSAEDQAIWKARREAIESSKELRLLETLVFKRTWKGRRGVFGHKVATYRELCDEAIANAISAALETALGNSRVVHSVGAVLLSMTGGDEVRRWLSEICESGGEVRYAKQLVDADAVPFLSAYRYTPSGMKKRVAWEKTWELQRREDAGESVGEIPVPPKYTANDFQQYGYYRLRGKLDVPKERFISYPGCESDEDGEAVYGWAGWDHLERAQALWNLYRERKEREGWARERLIPMLAGLLELMPWLHQWHSEPNEDGFRMNEELDNLLTAECHDLDVTREELAAWRPPDRAGRGKRRTKGGA